MKYVCINTAGDRVEAAAVNGEKRVYMRDKEFVQASRALMPMLDEVLDRAEMTLNQTDFLAVVVGPGSFTGIRIGVSTARAIAYALNKKIVAINSNELAAYNSIRRSKADFDSVLSALDAGNGYFYTAVYANSVDEVYFAPRCMTADELAAFRKEIDEPCLIAADSKAAGLLSTAQTEGDGIMDLALQRFKDGKFKDGKDIEPLYIRKPQAEENLK